MLRMWTVFLVLLGVGAALVCPDGGMCEDKNTCCKNIAGGYGCCPLPHAKCCSDHLHCCYQGTICDLVHQKCVNRTISLPWIVRRVPTNHTPSIPQLLQRLGGVVVEAIICPDQESECPDETTCCELPDGSWGCCPLAKAVCCDDKRHCCPEGTMCDVAHSKCLSASLDSRPLLEKVAARKRESSPVPDVGSVVCPGGKSRCSEGFSCCLLTSRDYGCCPFAQATCCSDHLHCCPIDAICDLEHNLCKSGKMHLPLMKKIPAVPNDIVCPDQKSACPDQTTCCQMINGSYGCCPMPDAVCCSDHIHCCPSGTQCDLQHSTCVSAQRNVSMTAVKMLANTAKLNETDRTGQAIPCNDSVACADGNTCCKSPDGEWACCPLAKAVCCEDHLHCCPHGTICNLAASTCDDGEGAVVMPWLIKEPIIPVLTGNSKCDTFTSCPGKSTCCKMASGDWACCPLPQAVCCDDHVHCCPHGTVCNVEAQTCDNPSAASSLSIWWLEKTSAMTLQEAQDEKCDKQTMCPGDTTCCKKDSGLWACCPLPQAVCCSDHEHCCPNGYKCNMAEQTCDKPDNLSLPWLQKISAQRREQEDRKMCDALTSCPRDTTCCFMDQTQKWGCCPLPNAICCKDGKHCCPSGHTCEPHRSSCSCRHQNHHHLIITPWFTKLSAETRLFAVSNVTDVKCDNRSSCASGMTCCKLPSGEWGCCPLVKAVCCADREHCCPQGYSCNMRTGTCEKKEKRMSHLLPQSSSDRPVVGGVAPCDASGEFYCSKAETCCRVSASEWSCCPSPRAVCCLDMRHCCPSGYSCDVQVGGCVLQSSSHLSWDSLSRDRKRRFRL